MKVAVVGCGALGSFYGGKLCRAGHETHFLLRSDYPIVRQRGVSVQSKDGDFHFNPKCARNPSDIGPADLVIIGLKTTANDQFGALIPPLVGANTAILTLQNGLGNEEQLARLFPVEQIMGGLAFVCLNRVAPGVIHHIDHGRVILGEFDRWPEPRTHEIAVAFRNAGVPCDVTDNLAQAHWEKLCWNIPFNGLGVASAAGLRAVQRGSVEPERLLGPCLTTDKLIEEPEWQALVVDIIQELITVARTLGLDLREDLPAVQIARTRTMGAYKPSTLLDYERGEPLELKSLFLEPLERAQRAGAPTPKLKALCDVLVQLDQARRLSR